MMVQYVGSAATARGSRWVEGAMGLGENRDLYSSGNIDRVFMRERYDQL